MNTFGGPGGIEFWALPAGILFGCIIAAIGVVAAEYYELREYKKR